MLRGGLAITWLVVTASLPLFFLVGVACPVEAIPELLQIVRVSNRLRLPRARRILMVSTTRSSRCMRVG
jgi:hypothetical protein